MDPETITSTATLIGAAVGLLTAVGAGIWKLIARADRIRADREAQLIPTLKAQIEAEKRENRRLRQINAIIRADAEKWREQLIRNDIEPDPADWTAYPPEEAS